MPLYSRSSKEGNYKLYAFQIHGEFYRKGLTKKQSENYVTIEKGMEYIKLFNELYKKVFGD